MIWVALAIAVLALGVAVVAAVRQERRLRAAHRRLHRLDRSLEQSELAIATLARLAVAARGGSDDDWPEPRSQHGEEAWLWQECGWRRGGVFVEIGAYDGLRLSNSAFFEAIGWTGLLVEADPALAEACRRNRPGSRVIEAALSSEDGGTVTFAKVEGGGGVDTLGFIEEAGDEAHRRRVARSGGQIESVTVSRRSLDSVLEETGCTQVDWMSIDVEGAELDVLAGFDLERFGPRVLMLEDNSGGSDRRVEQLIRPFGYRLAHRVGCNDIYVRAASAKRDAAPTAAPQLAEATR